jgi:hypothetical protein
MRPALMTVFAVLLHVLPLTVASAHVLDNQEDRPGSDLPAAAADARDLPAADLQIGGALDLGQPAAGSSRLASGGGASMQIIGARPGGPDLALELSPSYLGLEQDSAVAYAISRRLSLGVDYAYEEGEDLVERYAQIGSFAADHGSHNLVVKARWRF